MVVRKTATGLPPREQNAVLKRERAAASCGAEPSLAGVRPFSDLQGDPARARGLGESKNYVIKSSS